MKRGLYFIEVTRKEIRIWTIRKKKGKSKITITTTPLEKGGINKRKIENWDFRIKTKHAVLKDNRKQKHSLLFWWLCGSSPSWCCPLTSFCFSPTFSSRMVPPTGFSWQWVPSFWMNPGFWHNTSASQSLHVFIFSDLSTLATHSHCHSLGPPIPQCVPSTGATKSSTSGHISCYFGCKRWQIQGKAFVSYSSS